MRNWFFTDYTIPSDKNGEIVVRRRFGDWWIGVNNCGQTGQYTYIMWERAFRRMRDAGVLPAAHSPALMLGLGGGGQIKTINRYIPNVQLDVVEYDPQMVELALTLKLFEPYAAPNILTGDAAEVVPALTGTYALIILDLFAGPEPSPLAADASFTAALREHLAPRGVLLANVYGRPAYIDALAQRLVMLDRWNFKENSLGLYTHRQLPADKHAAAYGDNGPQHERGQHP